MLAKALEILIAYPPGNPATRQLSELLWKASLLVDPDGAPCGGRLALLLWEALKKLPSSNAMPRSYLLQLLHNARQLGVLRHLASTARPWDVTIAHCLNVFEKAESDAGLNPQVHQVVAAFRENVRSKANCKPWQLLFDRLAAAAVHGPEVGLRVAIRLEAQSAGPDGGLDLELLVCPSSIVDPPARLELVVGDESNSVHQLLLSDDYILYKEQLVSVHVPPRLLTTPGESMILPFLITGHTLSNQPIREMGRWELSNAQETFTPMTGQEIREAWPGVKGDPVTFQRGFYGRESDIRKLVAHLTTGERPGSIMLFGERRIGKTSLLWRFIELFPPQQGRVCCAS